MKKASPLLSIVFLIVASAVLTFRLTLLSSPFQLKHESPFMEIMKLPSFNDTLLKYASIDLADPKLKQEIEDLQGNLNLRHNFFLSSVRNKPRSARGLPMAMPMEVRSPEFRQVWLRFRRHLQDWFRKRRFQDDIMLELMNMVKSLIKGGKKYRSCAVVGNSGILLKSGYGDLIDSHEVVIRLNNARIGKFKNKVGEKTSISFVNSNILNSCAKRVDCFCHPYGNYVPIAMYICQPSHIFDYIKCNSSHKAPLIVTDPQFDVLCSRIVKYYSMKRFIALTGKGFEDWSSVHGGMEFHYSSGMQAVMLAVGVCDKVSIFGFGKSVHAKHHYHTNQRSELGLHDFEAEYDLYRDLVSKPDAIPFISDKFKFPTVVVFH